MRFIVCALLLAGCDTTPARPPLTFRPSELPEGQAGRAYEADIHVGNTQTPVCGAQVVSGALPPGLVVEKTRDGARISGIPEKAGDYEFTLQISCFGTNVSGQIGQMSTRIRVK